MPLDVDSLRELYQQARTELEVLGSFLESGDFTPAELLYEATAVNATLAQIASDLARHLVELEEAEDSPGTQPSG